MKNFVIIISVLLVFASCKKEQECDCFNSTGQIIMEQRNVESFNTIVLNNNINLILKQDSFFSCSVEAGEHLLSGIKTEVENGILKISNTNKCNWVRSFSKQINVYLNIKSIYRVEYNGSGNIVCQDTLHMDSLRFDSWDGSGKASFLIDSKSSIFNLNTGPADLEVSGSSGVNYLYSAGNGKADLLKLSTGYTFLTSKSTNNTFVNASKELYVWIDYIGDVFYKGTPYYIETKYTGKGRLIPYEE